MIRQFATRNSKGALPYRQKLRNFAVTILYNDKLQITDISYGKSRTDYPMCYSSTTMA